MNDVGSAETARYTSMRFGNIIWKINPKELKITDTRNISTENTVGGSAVVSDMGKNRRTVSGTGSFFGASATETLQRLKKMMDIGESGLLYYPGGEVFAARLCELRLLGAPGKNKVDYFFEFIECQTEPAKFAPECVFAADGETLWDIADRYSADIEALIKLNPQIRFINSINEGERICLK